MTLVVSILSMAVIYAVSVMYAGIGEIFAQRSGVMNLGLEGIMLMGAVSGYITACNTQNLALAVLVAILVGVGFGVVFSFLTITLKADQTVCGMAMLTFGTGLSGFIGQDYVSVAANLKFHKIAIPFLSEIPVIGPVFFNQDILVYAMYIILPVSMIYIYKTRPGMRLRALGENPAVLDAAGHNVFAMRYAYVTLGSAMCAVSGACITLSYINFWSPTMTAGKGWIAVALVTFASWNPAVLALGALLFGIVSNIGSNLQIYLPAIPSQIYTMLPYLVIIIAFVISTGNFRKKHTSEPASLCVPYDREER